MENDKLSLEEQLAMIKAFPLEPPLVVKSKKSLHAYWLLKEGKVTDFRRIQRGLVAHFDADPKCVNESRVLRIPGFNHTKDEPIMVECIKFSPHLRYCQSELEALLPSMPEEKQTDATATVAKGINNQLGLKVVGLKCQFIKHCGKNAKTLSEPDWYAMITNIAVFRDGDAAMVYAN
jgi:putative DNA primase/helicase